MQGKQKPPSAEEDSIWEEGYYAQSIDPRTLDGKMRTFHEIPGAALDHSCKKCGTAISAHNRDWHGGMCDGCFNDTYFPKNKPRP